MKLKILFLTISFLLIVQIQAEIPIVNLSDNDPLIPSNIASLYGDSNTYSGQTIIMKGIVSASFPKERFFILSDSMGCSSCSAAIKDTEILKVIFSGEIPEKRKIVVVSGNLTRGEDHTYLINATSVK